MALDLSSSLLLASEKERKRGKTAEEPRTERRKEPVVGESSSWILLCDRYSTIEVVDGCGSHRITSCFRDGELTHTHRASLFPYTLASLALQQSPAFLSNSRSSSSRRRIVYNRRSSCCCCRSGTL